jgi:hypothetical protein
VGVDVCRICWCLCKRYVHRRLNWLNDDALTTKTDVLQIRWYGLRQEIRSGVSEVRMERPTFFVCFTTSSTMIDAKQTFGVQMILVKSMIGENHQ